MALSEQEYYEMQAEKEREERETYSFENRVIHGFYIDQYGIRRDPNGNDEDTESIFEAEDIDHYGRPKIPTGIQQIDDILYGGLSSGLTVISGAEGKGKTTVVEQIISNFLIDERKRKIDGKDPWTNGVLIISPEMPTVDVKRVMMHQLADPSHIVIDERTKNPAFPWYKIQDLEKRRLKELYGQELYLQRTRMTPDGRQRVMAAMEAKAALGCKVQVADNLMSLTAIWACDPAYRGQSEIAIQGAISAWLAEFAARTGSWVFLIAHTRKQTAGFQADNAADDISGSSVTKNTATQILSYRVLTEKEIKYHRDGVFNAKGERKKDPATGMPLGGQYPKIDAEARSIRLIKNRNFGKWSKEVITTYDPARYRVYEYGKKPVIGVRHGSGVDYVILESTDKNKFDEYNSKQGPAWRPFKMPTDGDRTIE